MKKKLEKKFKNRKQKFCETKNLPYRSFRKETSEIRHVSFCVSANLASMRNFLGNVRKVIALDYDYRGKRWK